jgi:amino acid permease
MALPKAFATLGLVLGAAMLAVVFVLSFFSLGALVRWGAVG